MNNNAVVHVALRAFCCSLFIACNAQAGFLEMPDTSEVPEYEEGSMLLDLDIPGVRDRDPNPEAGPRLNVKEFRLQGIVEYPELGITREALIKQIEDIRFDLMKEDQQAVGGYSQEELAELADLIAKIEERTEGEYVETVDVQQLVFLIRDQRRRRGVTLGNIETVADTITRFYRERGFILAKAYIPKQRVRDGIVTLTLLLGELGSVVVDKNKRYSDREISRVFDDSIGAPVTAKETEENLYLINDLPGLAVRGYFQPGSQVGDTELAINVVEEQYYDSNIRFDNEGTDITGEYRAYWDLLVYKPWFVGGELYLSALNTFEPDNSQYGSFSYTRNLFSPRWRASAGYSQNAFVIGQDQIAVNADNEIAFTGETEVVNASVTRILRRSRAKNYSFVFGVSDIETLLKNSINTDDRNIDPDTNLNVTLSFNLDVVDEKRRWLHIANVGLTSSQFSPGQLQPSQIVQERATIFNYDYSMLSFVKPPWAKSESRLVFKSSGQYVGSVLSSANQFNMGGVKRARGFDVNELYADDGIYLGLDWIFKGPGFDSFSIAGEKFSRIAQPFLFVDYSYGNVYKVLAGDEKVRTVSLSDVGLGLNFNFKSYLRGTLSYAYVTGKDDGLSLTDNNPNQNGNLEVEEEEKTKLYFSLQFSF